MTEEVIDPGLLEQTKNQIRKLVAEIADDQLITFGGGGLQPAKLGDVSAHTPTIGSTGG